MHGPLQVPSNLSPEVLDLIVQLLNRDPKQRLGAGPGDAEEIKKHIFFKEINWDEAMQRKLKPPKPLLKPIIEKGATFEAFQESEFDSFAGTMHDWSFVAKDFK